MSCVRCLHKRRSWTVEGGIHELAFGEARPKLARLPLSCESNLYQSLRGLLSRLFEISLEIFLLRTVLRPVKETVEGKSVLTRERERLPCVGLQSFLGALDVGALREAR